jgi:4-amino-4-deoxy-L-arabinose transferase-like glycosyltransferase
LPVLWAVTVIAFFSLSRSKLEYYALPAFPALALLVGRSWQEDNRLGRCFLVGVLGCSLFGIWALWSGATLTREKALDLLADLIVYYRILREQGMPFPFPSVRPFGFFLQGLGLAVLGGWMLAAVLWWRGRSRLSFGAVVGTSALVCLLVFRLIRVVEPHHSAKAVSQALVARVRADDRILHEGSLEYSASLPFYTGRRIIVVNGTRGDLDFASRLPEARGWFLDDDGLAALWRGRRRVLFVTQKPLRKSALSKISGLPVYKIGEYGSRALYSNSDGEPG